MSLLTCVTCGILGWGIVLLVTPCLLKNCSRLNRCRAPDLHHSARSPVSRLGGLSLAAAYIGIECLALFFCPEENVWTVKRFVVTVAPLAIFTIGFWDDLKPLGARTKLMGQVLIAVAVTQSGVGIAGLKMPACEGII